MTERLYRIGELARLTGVPVKTIRYYSDLGLLPPAAVRGSGYRLYAERDRALRRRRAVLRAALARGDDALGTVERLRALSGLDAMERRQLLERWLDRAF